MTKERQGSGSSSEDDLFDLPSESIAADDLARNAPIAAGPDLEVPLAALPRRPAPPSPAGPPLASVSSPVDAILEHVRKRPAKSEDVSAKPAPTAEAVPQPSPAGIPRAVWMALGGLALGNVAALAVILFRPAPHTGSSTANVANVSIDDASVAGSSGRPHDGERAVSNENTAQVGGSNVEPLLPNTSAIEVARRTLRDARIDIESGRRGAARARLARIGLAIDAIDANDREDVRAEVALLIAESTQADAEEAQRAQKAQR